MKVEQFRWGIAGLASFRLRKKQKRLIVGIGGRASVQK